MAKKESNKFQLLTVFCGALAILYGWQFYKAFHIYTESRNTKIIFNGSICFLWIVLALFWFRHYKKLSDKEKDN